LADDLSQASKNVKSPHRDMTTLSAEVAANLPATGDRVKLFDLPTGCRFVTAGIRTTVEDTTVDTLTVLIVAETVTGDVSLTFTASVEVLGDVALWAASATGLLLVPPFGSKTVPIYLKSSLSNNPNLDGACWCYVGVIREDYDRD